MKKVTSALLAAVALSSAAFAADKGSMTGFYLGVNAGAANTNVKYDFNTNALPSTGTTAAAGYENKYKNDAGKLGYLLGAFAGYGMSFGNNAYVGVEVYGGFDTTTVKPYDDSASGKAVGFFKTSVKRKNYYGMAPRLGYMLTPSTMAYVRLGVEAGKWEAQVEPNAATINGLPASAPDKEASKKTFKASKNRINLVPGFGFETALSKNLFVRAEYSYLFGPSMSIDQNTKGYNNAVLSGNNVKHTLKVTQHAFKLGMGYKF